MCYVYNFTVVVLDKNEIQLQKLTPLTEQELLALHQSSKLQLLVGMYLEI